VKACEGVREYAGCATACEERYNALGCKGAIQSVLNVGFKGHLSHGLQFGFGLIIIRPHFGPSSQHRCPQIHILACSERGLS